MYKKTLAIVLILLSGLTFCGCGPKLPYEVVPIAGTITWQGQPVKSEAISLTFTPEGEGRPSSAWMAADGTFEAIYTPHVKGVQVGKCTLVLQWIGDVGGPCPKELESMFKKYGPGTNGYEMNIEKGNKKIVIALE